MLLCLAHSKFTKVENTRSQHGICLAFDNTLGQVIQLAYATGCNHGYFDGLGNSAR
jgi:hypothetical protein